MLSTVEFEAIGNVLTFEVQHKRIDEIHQKAHGNENAAVVSRSPIDITRGNNNIALSGLLPQIADKLRWVGTISIHEQNILPTRPQDSRPDSIAKKIPTFTAEIGGVMLIANFAGVVHWGAGVNDNNLAAYPETSHHLVQPGKELPQVFLFKIGRKKDAKSHIIGHV